MESLGDILLYINTKLDELGYSILTNKRVYSDRVYWGHCEIEIEFYLMCKDCEFELILISGGYTHCSNKFSERASDFNRVACDNFEILKKCISNKLNVEL